MPKILTKTGINWCHFLPDNAEQYRKEIVYICIFKSNICINRGTLYNEACFGNGDQNT